MPYKMRGDVLVTASKDGYTEGSLEIKDPTSDNYMVLILKKK